MSAEIKDIIVPVRLGARSYDVVIGSGALARIDRVLPPHIARRKLAIVTDEIVARLHHGAIAAAFPNAPMIKIEAGEASKSFSGLEAVVEALIALKLERRDAIIAFGGGVVGDLAGFAAAIVKRGIDFIQIPTTLLAQVDSSVGGKTAINSRHGKNLIGAFHQPRLVLADTAFLATLDARELRAGYAEIVKCGLIADAAFFARLEREGARLIAGDEAVRVAAIARAVAMKAEIVAEDEQENGRRALLNLGHTFAHAYEATAHYGNALLHGEAVALGLHLAFAFSEALGLAPAEATLRVKRHLQAIGLPVLPCDLPIAPPSAERIVELMLQDKKVESGMLNFVLVRGIGEAFIAKDVPQSEVIAFLSAL